MSTLNQEISLKVAENNETATVTAKTPALDGIFGPLPPPTTAPKPPSYNIYSPHPDDVEVPPKGMAYSDWKERKAEPPTPPTNCNHTKKNSSTKPKANKSAMRFGSR